MSEDPPPYNIDGTSDNAARRYQWSKLNNIQKGTYGEYFAKMEFAMYGFEVYTSEVDDRGIDFVVRGPSGSFYEVQVKTVTDFNLAFVSELKFKDFSSYLMALVRLVESESPQLYVFRGTDWPSSDGLLVYNPYEGKKSDPAYEIHLAQKRMNELGAYSFENRVKELLSC